MNILDWILLAIIALLALRCLFRGLVAEFMAVAAPVGGLLAAVLFYRPVGTWLGSMIELGGFALVLGFLSCFILVFVIAKILERSLRTVLEKLRLSALDKGLGFVYGAAEGLVIAAIILILIRYQPVFDASKLLDDSFIARLLLPLVAEAMPKQSASAAFLPYV